MDWVNNIQRLSLAEIDRLLIKYPYFNALHLVKAKRLDAKGQDLDVGLHIGDDFAFRRFFFDVNLPTGMEELVEAREEDKEAETKTYTEPITEELSKKVEVEVVKPEEKIEQPKVELKPEPKIEEKKVVQEPIAEKPAAIEKKSAAPSSFKDEIAAIKQAAKKKYLKQKELDDKNEAQRKIEIEAKRKERLSKLEELGLGSDIKDSKDDKKSIRVEKENAPLTEPQKPEVKKSEVSHLATPKEETKKAKSKKEVKTEPPVKSSPVKAEKAKPKEKSEAQEKKKAVKNAIANSSSGEHSFNSWFGVLKGKEDDSSIETPKRRKVQENVILEAKSKSVVDKSKTAKPKTVKKSKASKTGQESSKNPEIAPFDEQYSNDLEHFLDDKESKGKSAKEPKKESAKGSKGSGQEFSTKVESFTVETESMAKVYELQGKTGKARMIYKSLSLKYPKKSSYFASLIEKLNK